MRIKNYLAITTAATSFAIIVTVTVAIFFLMQTSYRDSVKQKGRELARVVALDPNVIQALEKHSISPDSKIQQYIENIRSKTNASYIVITDKDAIRLSHPNTNKVGKHFVGDDIYNAIEKGQEYSTVSSGSLGKAIRNFSPVFYQGKVIGVVCIGYLLEKTSTLFLQQFGTIGMLIVGVFVLCITMVLFLLFKMKRTFLDFEPEFVVRKFREHELVFDSIQDAILAVDSNMSITTINNNAIKLLSDGHYDRYDCIHRPLAYFSSQLSHFVLNNQGNFRQQDLEIGTMTIRANLYPIRDTKGLNGHALVLLTKFKQNELQKELIYLKNYADILRSKTHEYSNKLNVISGMLQMGNSSEAIEFIQQETDNYQSIIRDIVTSISDSVVAGLILAKFNKALDMNVRYSIDEDSTLESYGKSAAEKLVTILGNLVDNALLAAWQNKQRVEPSLHLYLSDRGNQIVIEIEDTGTGISPELSSNILDFGVTSKTNHEQNGVGLYLVKQWVDYFDGSIEWDRTEKNTTLFSIYLDKSSVESYE